MDQVYPDKNITFKVDARRGDKQYPVTSEQINRDMGEAILRCVPTDESGCHIIRMCCCGWKMRQKVNLFSQMIPGPGGMPIGTNGQGHAAAFRRY